MYERETDAAILQRMLQRAPDDIDKREGSLIFAASSGAALELARYYAELDVFRRMALVQTSTGAFLDQLVYNKNVVRVAASKAVRRAIYTWQEGVSGEIPVGERFTLDGLVFIATGPDLVECETLGATGNAAWGLLLPGRTIYGLERAELGEIVIPGRDAETDEALRRRFLDFDGEAYGGNIADYKQKTLGIAGVGAVRVYPIWDGGGTVKLVILDALLAPPSPELVALVQEVIDPAPHNQLGYGLAPIGHWVTVEGAASDEITVSAVLAQMPDAPTTTAQHVKDAIGAYVTSLAEQWSAGPITVNVSGIIAAALDVPGVQDLRDILINGTSGNYAVPTDAVPSVAEVTLLAAE